MWIQTSVRSLHNTGQTVTTHRYKCAAASSRPIRTTSISPPEALLRCTHASRLQRGQPRALAAAMSCEHRCDRKGRNSVRSGLQHGHGQGGDWCWTVGFESRGTWLRECTAESSAVSRQFKELLPALRKEKTWKASGSSQRREIESQNPATQKKWCARAVTLAEAARASPCSEH